MLSTPLLDLLFAVGAQIFSEAAPVETCKPAPQVAPHPVFCWLNFSSADNAGVHSYLFFHGAFFTASPLFYARTERSRCLQFARRTPTNAAADPFWTDRGCSGFRARFARERDRERQHVPPTPCPRGEDRRRSVDLRGTSKRPNDGIGPSRLDCLSKLAL